ncbi:MAG: hypothetical protein DRO18_00560 [Thermoprotei archaeon]|nr:MAG: hypothetical protein DRO18_00560 [Thermoprotei archaeon]
MMLGLLLYKGLSIVYNYSLNPYGGITHADHALFFGSHVLRESLYGLAHVVMGIGLVWYVIALLKGESKVFSPLRVELTRFPQIRR